VNSGDDILEEYKDAKTGRRLANKKKHTFPNDARQRQTSHQPLNLVFSPQLDLIKDIQRAAPTLQSCQIVREYATK
jgi:hypothetical protein